MMESQHPSKDGSTFDPDDIISQLGQKSVSRHQDFLEKLIDPLDPEQLSHWTPNARKHTEPGRVTFAVDQDKRQGAAVGREGQPTQLLRLRGPKEILLMVRFRPPHLERLPIRDPEDAPGFSVGPTPGRALVGAGRLDRDDFFHRAGACVDPKEA